MPNIAIIHHGQTAHLRKTLRSRLGMAKSDVKSLACLGFLTVVEHPQYGLFGGYLVLNQSGRPLEFHCTAPIKPNRAQEILYGPTLEAFLYGEQIGQTLLGQSKTEPMVVCTNRQPVLAAREFVSMPMVLVLPPDGDSAPEGKLDNAANDNAAGDTSDRTSDSVGDVDPHGAAANAASSSKKFFRIDPPHPGGPRLVTFSLGRNRLALSEQVGNDRQSVIERIGELADTFDLAEPFQRIREAIEEAQQAVR
jgi:hypothetical protein